MRDGLSETLVAHAQMLAEYVSRHRLFGQGVEYLLCKGALGAFGVAGAGLVEEGQVRCGFCSQLDDDGIGGWMRAVLGMEFDPPLAA